MYQPDQIQVQHMMLAMLPFMALAGVLGAALIIVPFWVIFKKAGLGGPLSLLMLLPFVGIIMLYVLAFSRWKVVPAPEYAGYPPAYPPPPVYPATAYPAQPGYVASQQAAPAYVPPPDPPSTI